MSIEKRELITCPDCGKEGTFIVWESLNTQLNPEAKDDLISGKIFRFKCPHCNNVHNVNYGMLYHQMEKQIMIQYSTTDENAQQGIDAFEKMQNQEFAGLPALGVDYKFRIVRSQNQLREKAYIFEQNLDDRVIELMKLFMRIQLGETNPDLEIQEMYLEISTDGPESFAIRLADGQWASTEFAQGLYDAVYDGFVKNMADEKEYFIDANWALNILKNGR